MSDHREPETDQLERRLDAAFQGTRPRRGFEDELWARLQARRPWWRRLGEPMRRVPLGGVAVGVVAVVTVGLLVATLARFAGPQGGGGRSSATATLSGGQQPGTAAAPAARAPSLPYGRLPAPSGAGVVQAARPAGASALPGGSQRVDAAAASPPAVQASLAVYRFDPASGPADGTVLDPGQVPAGLAPAFYPSRQPADAVAAAPSAGQPVALTQARLVYVAVVSGGEGYLEPAYLYTGVAGSGNVPVQLLVSALAPSALR